MHYLRKLCCTYFISCSYFQTIQSSQPWREGQETSKPRNLSRSKGSGSCPNFCSLQPLTKFKDFVCCMLRSSDSKCVTLDEKALLYVPPSSTYSPFRLWYTEKEVFRHTWTYYRFMPTVQYIRIYYYLVHNSSTLIPNERRAQYSFSSHKKAFLL